MKRLLLLMLLCVASCKHPSPPQDPPPGGVNIDAPFVRIRTNSPPQQPVEPNASRVLPLR